MADLGLPLVQSIGEVQDRGGAVLWLIDSLAAPAARFVTADPVGIGSGGATDAAGASGSGVVGGVVSGLGSTVNGVVGSAVGTAGGVVSTVGSVAGAVLRKR